MVHNFFIRYQYQKILHIFSSETRYNSTTDFTLISLSTGLRYDSNIVFCFTLLDESPTSVNLENDRGFIVKEYSIKQIYENLYSKWVISYHCGESCSSTIY